jgi:hypothetical protein
MVGRIIRRLKDRGVLREPIRNHVSAHWRGIKRSYATRKPKDYPVIEPGDLIQLDTLDIRPLPGVMLKHFTARDVILRWDVIDVYSRATPIHRGPLLGRARAEDAFQHEGYSGRWWLRIRGGFRGGMPASPHKALCPATTVT